MTDAAHDPVTIVLSTGRDDREPIEFDLERDTYAQLERRAGDLGVPTSALVVSLLTIPMYARQLTDLVDATLSGAHPVDDVAIARIRTELPRYAAELVAAFDDLHAARTAQPPDRRD